MPQPDQSESAEKHWIAYRKDGSAPPIVFYKDRLAGFKHSTAHRIEGPFVLDREPASDEEDRRG